MYGQLIFEPFWKSRYVQMLISCGIDSVEAFRLIRSMGLIEANTKSDVCALTQEQASIARVTVKEAFPEQYEVIMSRLSDYVEWRKLFEPYMEQPLRRDEILNSKEMSEIVDAPLTPEDLESIIVATLGDKTINIAAPCLCLAWMEYETPDMAELKENDVNFDKHTLCGVHVPDPLWRVLKRYHDTDSEIVPNRWSGRRIYKLPGEWLIKSTDSVKMTAESKVDPRKLTMSVANVARRYRQVAGRDRRITVHLTQIAGMLYRLYNPWETFEDEQFVDVLRFKGRTYDTYQMQSWKRTFTAYCLLREMRKAT